MTAPGAKAVIGGRVLDTSALLAFATESSVYCAALVWTAVKESIVLAIPSTAVAAAWATLDGDKHPVWCRTPPGEPDIEVPTGTKGTVTEFVRKGSSGSYGYRITWDNGALWGTYLPAPWAIKLTRGDTPPERARVS